jgi:pyridinium-3,5-biscarboxylic acid mononucleotide sulfurtransferase
MQASTASTASRAGTVGFDLDMTLIDSRPGIKAVYDALALETGVPIDSAAAVTRLGPPLDEELLRWYPPEQLAAAGDRYRALYPSLAIEPTPALPGAAEAVAAVRAAGGTTVVITGKYEPNARLHLARLGIDADVVLGWRWAETKTTALLEHSVGVYVGDHEADVAAAVAAGAVAVGVPTGAASADKLWAAGADVVLTDLTAFPAWYAEHLLASRLADLNDRLVALGTVLVAFSGGADSAFLLAAAVRALGPYHVVAATAVSSSLPATELAAAQAFAAEVGVRHLTPRTYELAVEGYRANNGDRCYFCKAELLDVLRPVADSLAVAHVATGTNADDAVAGFRPGLRAAAERGAVTPLLDAGLTKAQVRAASREWGLLTWDKPAAACLSSRIAFGIEVTRDRLARVERAELELRAVFAAAAVEDPELAVRDLRVRDLGGGAEVARVEIDPEAVAAVLARPDLLMAVVEAVRTAGFDTVEVDPRGFRSGAMNELLAEPELYR